MKRPPRGAFSFVDGGFAFIGAKSCRVRSTCSRVLRLNPARASTRTPFTKVTYKKPIMLVPDETGRASLTPVYELKKANPFERWGRKVTGLKGRRCRCGSSSERCFAADSAAYPRRRSCRLINVARTGATRLPIGLRTNNCSREICSDGPRDDQTDGGFVRRTSCAENGRMPASGRAPCLIVAYQ